MNIATQNLVPYAAAKESVKSCDLFQSGEWFTATELANSSGLSKHFCDQTINQMKDAGSISFKERPKKMTLYRKPSLSAMEIVAGTLGRTHTNKEIGITRFDHIPFAAI